MSNSSSGDSSGCGCGCGGCVMLILFIFIMWSVCFGLPVGEKTWNVDIFPPRIWEMKGEINVSSESSIKRDGTDTEVVEKW